MDKIHDALTPEEMKGIWAEQRLVALCNDKTKAPKGVLGARLAYARLDALGCDVLISLKRSDDTIITVPVQVKSSKAGLEDHQRTNKDWWFWRIPIVIVSESDDDLSLRRHVETALRHVRKGKYTFRPFFSELKTRHVSRKLIRQIKEKRMLYEQTACQYGRCPYFFTGGTQGEVIQTIPGRPPCGHCYQGQLVSSETVSVPPQGYRRLTLEERGE